MFRCQTSSFDGNKIPRSRGEAFRRCDSTIGLWCLNSHKTTNFRWDNEYISLCWVLIYPPGNVATLRWTPLVSVLPQTQEELASHRGSSRLVGAPKMLFLFWSLTSGFLLIFWGGSVTLGGILQGIVLHSTDTHTHTHTN